MAADTVLIRRYLDAGGKVVWIGTALGRVARDSTGKAIGIAAEGMKKLLGVRFDDNNSDRNPAIPTAAGRRWGLDGLIPGLGTLTPSAAILPLALDERGGSTAWVRAYRPELPGSGYVQLWGMGASLERLPMIRAAAEYGLLRRAAKE